MNRPVAFRASSMFLLATLVFLVIGIQSSAPLAEALFSLSAVLAALTGLLGLASPTPAPVPVRVRPSRRRR